ncbi:MAG: DUF1501 domain-containing protein [Gemmataceae bacterium]|nr:DUF1501 domain-containing protein [Gemmataceae bacterium]
MFRVTGGTGTDCTGLTRRTFLQAGALGGLGLADLYRARIASAAQPKVSDPAVILFWMSGGPGHMETWDPKPDAVDQFRGPFGSIRTSVPGVQFGELLPNEARLMHRLAVLRGVNHGSGDHTKGNHWMLTGFEGPAFNAPDFMTQRRPCMGSAASKLVGPRRPGLPGYAAVPHLRGGTDNFFHYAAYLGRGFNPFVTESDPNTPEFRVRNLTLPADMPMARIENRKYLRDALDQHRLVADDRAAVLDPHVQRAFGLLTSKEAAAAFDIAAEPDKVRDRYGRHTFGQSALLARRLVEAGVTFVTVNCVPWDHHGNGGRMKTAEGAKLLIPPFDLALAALVEDLIERGLYDRTLVVAMGEFGRTPRMNSDAGRDHWGNAFSVLMGGGSMKMGQVIGKSTARGEYVADRPVTPQDVTATVFHHLGINAREVLFPDTVSRPTALVESGEPVRELVG